MKKILLVFISIGIIAAAIFASQGIIAQAQDYFTKSVCDVPITYRIVSVDPRFGKSPENFSKDIEEAAQIWQTATGKQLFTYDPQGEVSVSFTYDKRQSLTTEINTLEGKLKENDAAIKAEIIAYESRVGDFNTRINALNSEIDSWNTKGGAPEEVYHDLKRRQDELKKEAAELNKEAQRLNVSTQDFNQQVGSLNTRIEAFNTTIKQEPEEGLYDPQTKSITIYFYNNEAELIHTIMHELGHARGAEHVSDPQGIMYAYTSETTIPTSEDIAAINQTCKEKYISRLTKEYILSLRKFFTTAVEEAKQ